jgi:hypothetical protein
VNEAVHKPSPTPSAAAREPLADGRPQLPKIADAEIWAAATEHHFALVVARHLLTALELEPPSSVASSNPTISAGIASAVAFSPRSWISSIEAATPYNCTVAT